MIAIRGTLSTGFRAPTLAEEFYTAVNVSPTSATVQLPANSAAAALLGLGNLQPETSISYSAGIVAHPLDDLSVTVDAYSIAIGNRITTSATVNSSGGSINVPLVTPAVQLDGVSLDPTATQQGVTGLPERPFHAHPGRRLHGQLSDRFRRLWPGGLDFGGQLQQHGGIPRSADADPDHRFCPGCDLLPAGHAVRLRP